MSKKLIARFTYEVSVCWSREAHSHKRHHELMAGNGGMEQVWSYGDSPDCVGECSEGVGGLTLLENPFREEFIVSNIFR